MNNAIVFNSPEGKAAILQYSDMLWEHMTTPYERQNVDTRFGNTSVIASGERNAPPIVLLHGSSMNSAMWISDIQKLNKKYRVYTPDMPGEPGRSVEKQLPFDTLDYTNWLTDVFDGLSIDKAVVAGASLGAWLAAKFAINHPEKVAELVLLCPAGVGSQNHEFKSVALSLLPKGEEGINELFALINGGDPIPEIMLNYQKLIGACFNSRTEEIPLFTDEELRSLTMPSAVFVGGKDIMLKSVETAERYKRLVPNGKVVMMPEKGHSLTGLTDEIMAFLDNAAKTKHRPEPPKTKKPQQRER